MPWTLVIDGWILNINFHTNGTKCNSIRKKISTVDAEYYSLLP